MKSDDLFHATVIDAVRSCTLPSIDALLTTADDLSLIAHDFDELGFDSLAFMEFCIAIHLATGIEMDIAQTQALRTPAAVVEYLRRCWRPS